MSWVTGPNEDALMAQRAVFGLLLWETLPSGAQRRTITDLAGAIAGGLMDDHALSRAKKVLQTKSAETRSNIAGTLNSVQVSQADLGRLGL
jgi:hypothetical protein